MAKSCCYYDLSVLSSVNVNYGLKKSLDRRGGGWGELYPVIIWIFGIF